MTSALGDEDAFFVNSRILNKFVWRGSYRLKADIARRLLLAVSPSKRTCLPWETVSPNGDSRCLKADTQRMSQCDRDYLIADTCACRGAAVPV